MVASDGSALQPTAASIESRYEILQKTFPTSAGGI